MQKEDIQRYRAITCEVMAREAYYCASIAYHQIDIVLIRQGLHDMGETKMQQYLQEEIDRTDIKLYDAILLIYGLCNNGIRGLHAPIPMVVPRAHDCITLLLGSKERYHQYFSSHPGTYYRSPGWIERAHDDLSNPESLTRQMGFSTYQEYVEKYGKENADFLIEMLGNKLKHYDTISYIYSEIPFSQDKYLQETKQLAEEKRYHFSVLEGKNTLLLDMMNGYWDEERFLVVPPHHEIIPTYDDRIITSRLRVK